MCFLRCMNVQFLKHLSIYKTFFYMTHLEFTCLTYPFSLDAVKENTP